MSKIEAVALCSGSSGNSVYVKTEDITMLIDAGVSARAVEKALTSIGSSLDKIDVIFVTHEHSDHVKGLEVIAKHHSIPVHMVEDSARAMIHNPKSALLQNLYLHPAEGFSVKFGNTTVKAFPIPHDSVAAVGYTVTYENASGDKEKFGLATDIGHVTEMAFHELAGSDYALVEANHDVEMLLSGRYPYQLKRRILSDHGHLSNESCAALCKALVESGTRRFVLGHLSKENNYPATADACVRAVLPKDGSVTLAVASPDIPTKIWPIE